MEELVDTFGRRHDYLRISLTDQCNFRCTYCMPEENMKFMKTDKLMQPLEIYDLAKIFTEMGVNKIRLTGGEPTLRKDLPEIISLLSTLGAKQSITTNGALLDKHLSHFKSSGLNNLNISIDSLQSQKFKRITQRDLMEKVIQNIGMAVNQGFEVRINVVVIRNFNDDELVDFIRWSSDLNIEVRFIEFMPFFGNQWDYEKVFSHKEMLETIEQEFSFSQLSTSIDSTALRYAVEQSGGRFGIIPTVTNPFCQGCNRIRITADGKLKNCLFSVDETDILGPHRRGENVQDLIRSNIARKKMSAAGNINFNDEKAKLEYAINRPMVAIGG